MSDMIIRNLTPHDVTVVKDDGSVIRSISPDSVGPARAKQTTFPIGNLDGIPLYAIEYGEPEGLPPKEDGIYLIVSKITAESAASHGREIDDLFIVAETIRDEKGSVVGTKGLVPYDPIPAFSDSEKKKSKLIKWLKEVNEGLKFIPSDPDDIIVMKWS